MNYFLDEASSGSDDIEDEDINIDPPTAILFDTELAAEHSVSFLVRTFHRLKLLIIIFF